MRCINRRILTYLLTYYRTEVIPMTMSDLQGHSPTQDLFNFEFSYSCAADDKISTDARGPSIIR